MATTHTHAAAAKTEFQVLLHMEPVGTDTDEGLAQFAEMGLGALLSEAQGLALGPVASVDLDQRLVQFELTVEAASASEVQHKIGLIFAAFERGTGGTIVDTSTSRARDPERDRDLVCA